MIARVHRASVLAAYQLCIAVGIAVMPLAILGRRIGLTLPVHRLLDRLDAAYENAGESA